MKMHIALPFAAVMLAGCGASDHSRFYVLTENPAAASRATAISPATTIGLGAIQLPAALDRPQMARRLNSDEISYSENDRWAGPLDEMVRRVLIADLDGRLAPEMILIENNPTSQASRTIAVNILQFDADATGLVTLKARWELLGRSGALVGAPRNAVIVKTGSGRDGEAVAATMSRALADLSGDIAAGLGTVAAIEPEGQNGGKFRRSVSDLREISRDHPPFEAEKRHTHICPKTVRFSNPPVSSSC